jgi:hypothetical protein
MRTIGGDMSHRGFTRQELREIFNLDPDRPEDRPAIAALQASLTRQLDTPRTASARREAGDVVARLVRMPDEEPPEDRIDPCA